MNDGEEQRRFSWKRVKPFPVLLPALLILLMFPSLIWSQALSASQMANAQYQGGQYDSALVNYSRAIAENPAKKEGYYNRGLCYYHLNRLTEAIHDFTTCLQTDPVFDDARFMIIITLQKQGDWNAADTEFKKLNTSCTGYKELEKRIHYHRLSVILSRNWYYMIAIMFLFIILVAVAAKSYAVKKGT